MQLGSLEETVSVEAAAPLVETRNPSIGAVIDNEAVEALPLEGRNPVALVMMAGAAVYTGNPSSRSLTGSRGIAIAGGQQFGVAYLLDGALHNNVYDGVNLPLPFPDALLEFRVEASSQNAQNGYKAGGTASIATNDQAGPPVLLWCVSGHARDPDTCGYRYLHPDRGDDVRRFSTVASAQCRAQGNLTLPAALGFANNRIDPALMSPAALRIARMLPTTSDPCGQISYSRPTKPREGQSIGKVDWQITQNHSLFGRYMLSTTFWDPAFVNADGNILAATLGGRDNRQDSFVLGDTMVLSNTIVNNIRAVPDRRLRDRPVLLRFTLGPAVRPRTASHRRPVRRPVGVGRTGESVPRGSRRCQLSVQSGVVLALHHGPVRHQDDAEPQLERCAAATGRREHGSVRDVSREPHGQCVGCGRWQPGSHPPWGHESNRPMHAEPLERRHPDVPELLGGEHVGSAA
jgi:hypothetical protein